MIKLLIRIEKARRGGHLVPEKRTVTRAGRSFQMTVWENPDINKSLTFSGWKLQGRMKFQGLQISVENRKGTYRTGINDKGRKWRNYMHYPYGYIRGTVGKDKDHLDCYIGPNKESNRVFIVHQNNPETGKYDEDKVMLGWNTPGEAKKAYLGQYDSPKFFGSMEETDIDTFKEKALNKNNHGKKLTTRS